jgi:hypothetical protein
MEQTALAKSPMNTREEYLLAAVEELRPMFTKNKLVIQPVKVSCGFGSKSPMKRLGECWQAGACADSITRNIFISPLNKTAVEALATLVHELVHASLPDEEKHGKMFKEAMKALGLEGKATSTYAGPALLEQLEAIVDKLGDYPTSRLIPKEKSKNEKAKAKKSFKLFCPRKRNGEKACILVDKTAGGDYNVTASRKSLKLGFPLCPCGAEMEMEPEDFELYKLSE